MVQWPRRQHYEKPRIPRASTAKVAGTLVGRLDRPRLTVDGCYRGGAHRHLPTTRFLPGPRSIPVSQARARRVCAWCARVGAVARPAGGTVTRPMMLPRRRRLGWSPPAALLHHEPLNAIGLAAAAAAIIFFGSRRAALRARFA
jgi:hypothetical protein